MYLQPEGHFRVEVVLFLSYSVCTHCPNHLNLIIVIYHLDLVSRVGGWDGEGGSVCVCAYTFDPSYSVYSSIVTNEDGCQKHSAFLLVLVQASNQHRHNNHEGTQ